MSEEAFIQQEQLRKEAEKRKCNMQAGVIEQENTANELYGRIEGLINILDKPLMELEQYKKDLEKLHIEHLTRMTATSPLLTKDASEALAKINSDITAKIEEALLDDQSFRDEIRQLIKDFADLYLSQQKKQITRETASLDLLDKALREYS